MRTDAVPRLAAFASSHHGLFRWTDAVACGVTRSALERLVRDGWCARPTRGVYRVSAAPMTSVQADLTAVWSAGSSSAVSHRAAARSWLIPGFRNARPEVVRPHGQSHRGTLGRLHLTRALPPQHVVVRGVVPVTSPARTVFDLTARCHPDLVQRSLDFVLQRNLCSLTEVHQVFFALARRGRAGTTLMRELLQARGVGYVPPASELERIARRVFADAGLPTPDYEVDLGDTDWIGRVDCLWRREKVIVELDGRSYHGGVVAELADRERDNRLMARGWRVIRVTWDDLVKRPDTVVSWIRSALRASAA